MGLETATYLDSLNTSWPLGTDAESTSDDHHRLIKACLLRTFPNINAEVRATPANLNFLTGVAQDVQVALSQYSASISAALARIGTMSSSLATLEARVVSISGQMILVSTGLTPIISLTLASATASISLTLGWTGLAIRDSIEMWTSGAATNITIPTGYLRARMTFNSTYIAQRSAGGDVILTLGQAGASTLSFRRFRWDQEVPTAGAGSVTFGVNVVTPWFSATAAMILNVVATGHTSSSRFVSNMLTVEYKQNP